MTRLDALLVSLVAGMSLFTLYLFASDYPAPLNRAAPPRHHLVQGVILHGFETPHRHAAYHIHATPEGPVFTRFWSSGEPTPHTGRREVNDVTLSIMIEPGAMRDDVIRVALALCREYGLPPERILSHEEMEPAVACPGPAVEMDDLRRDLAKRLR